MNLPTPATVAGLLFERILRPVRRELQPFLHEDVEHGDSLSHVVLSLVAGLVAFACTLVAAALVVLPALLYVALYATVGLLVRGLHALRNRR